MSVSIVLTLKVSAIYLDKDFVQIHHGNWDPETSRSPIAEDELVDPHHLLQAVLVIDQPPLWAKDFWVVSKD
jgi:hypothetical protein